MAVLWILALAGVSLFVVLVVALGRRQGDDVRNGVRSFDAFRSALSPEVEGLGEDTARLGHRLDRVDPPAGTPRT